MKTSSGGRMMSILMVVSLSCVALSMEWLEIPIGKGVLDMCYPKTAALQRPSNYQVISATKQLQQNNQKSKRKQKQKRLQAQSKPPPPTQEMPRQETLPQQQQHQLQLSTPNKSSKFFAMHIGPSKTGTSAIQKSLAGLQMETDVMSEDKDNVIYIGKRILAKWQDPHIRKPYRTIDGNDITPFDEVRVYQKIAKPCMLNILNEYYETHADDDTVEIEDRLEHDAATRESLKNRFTNECWTGIRLHGLKGPHDFRYMLDKSIVDSNESYSYNHMRKFVDYGRIFWIFDILGYDTLRLVAAYRRYAEWQVSCYTQKIKVDCLNGVVNEGHMLGTPCKRFDEFLHLGLAMTGAKRFDARFYSSIHLSLPKITAAGPSKLEVKILNFYVQPKPSSESEETYNSITTELYCDALGMDLTPHSCNKSREIWMASNDRRRNLRSNNSTTPAKPVAAADLVVNKGSTSDSIYQSIVAAGYRLGYLLPSDELLEQTAQKQKRCKAGGAHLFWCEVIGECLQFEKNGKCLVEFHKRKKERKDITADGTISIVGAKDHAVSTYQELSKYHTEVNRASWTETLPVQCPTRKTLEKFLERSLELEEAVMPDFYKTPFGKADHERLFWDVWVEEKKIFCWVDIDRLFARATSWDQIINERMVRRDWVVSYDDYNGGRQKPRILSSGEFARVEI